MRNHARDHAFLIFILFVIFFLSIIPASTAGSINVEPIGSESYQIKILEDGIDDGRNSVMIRGKVENIGDKGAWIDIVAWVVDDGEEIARYYNSLGYLEKEDYEFFTVSFRKDDRWKEAAAKGPLKVYIEIVPREEPIKTASRVPCC